MKYTLLILLLLVNTIYCTINPNPTLTYDNLQNVNDLKGLEANLQDSLKGLEENFLENFNALHLSNLKLMINNQTHNKIHSKISLYNVNGIDNELIDNKFFLKDLENYMSIDEEGNVIFEFCDLTDIFKDADGFEITIANLLGAKIVTAHIYMDACLVVKFDPCSETTAIRFVQNSPLKVVFAGFGNAKLAIRSLEFDLPNVGKEFHLPNIMDRDNFLPNIDGYCQIWNIDHIPDVKLCVNLNNFTVNANGLKVCPTVTIHIGTKRILEITYSAVNKVIKKIAGHDVCINQEDATNCDCIVMQYIPTCNNNKTIFSPRHVKTYRSMDVNNDFKVDLQEFKNAVLTLGIPLHESEGEETFQSIDKNHDEVVTFNEFQSYSSEKLKENDTYGPTFSSGDMAATIILTCLTTILLSAIALKCIMKRKLCPEKMGYILS